ncbi:hypothetical protein [Nocardia sp. XZ_19_369]|uniref:hypothetical protein n=1 Tax=Nocardia sp. XZ_19_369 TaxID=2769487 RepID=UPI0027D24A7E|nr:hypothetical protein [Nocardia sp. XZ_19_369]
MRVPEHLMQPTDETSSDPAWIDYADFGAHFVTAAVTKDRIEAAVAGMTGRGMTIGPFSLGPAGLAGFVAEGKVGKPEVVHSGPHVTFQVTVPVSLALKVMLGGKKLRLEARVEIDLTLHARTADPLLIVIDIPPVTPPDVSFVLRAQAVDAAGEVLLDPIAGLVQREVAARVNGMLADPQARRSRVFDVEAIVSGTPSTHREQAEFDWIGYDEFGHRFFSHIVTRDRVFDVVERMAGRPIEVGPLKTGPGKSATVTVRGNVRVPQLADKADTPRAFDLTLPVSLDITVDVLKANRYRADVEVPLVLTARAADPLLIVIDVPPPDPDDIRLEFKAHGVRAATLGALAGIKKQVIAQVAGVVRKELADSSGRTIDVAARIGSSAPRSTSGASADSETDSADSAEASSRT